MKLKIPEKYGDGKKPILIQVPASLKAHFKAYCAKRGKSMTGIISAFMRKRVESKK